MSLYRGLRGGIGAAGMVWAGGGAGAGGSGSSADTGGAGSGGGIEIGAVAAGHRAFALGLGGAAGFWDRRNFQRVVGETETCFCFFSSAMMRRNDQRRRRHWRMSGPYGSNFRTGPGRAFAKNSSKSLSILPHYRRTPSEQRVNKERTPSEQKVNIWRTVPDLTPR
jgi:hypothetical protein